MESPASLPAPGDLDRIEAAVLPNISILLDTLLDAAGAARPGEDANRYAGELRMLALGAEELTRQLEAVMPPPQAAARLRMSA